MRGERNGKIDNNKSSILHQKNPPMGAENNRPNRKFMMETDFVVKKFDASHLES